MSTDSRLHDPATQRAMIANNLSRYAWAYDMDDMALLATCFTQQAEVLFNTGPKAGRAEVVAELQRRRAAYRPDRLPWHLITNIYIEPDTATSVKVASWYAFGPMAPDLQGSLASFGWYDDRFSIEDGDWRIAHRRVLQPWDR